MSTHSNICQNSKCRATYIPSQKEADDGYCSFVCWEEANCSDPENIGDVLEAHVEEIIKQG